MCAFAPASACRFRSFVSNALQKCGAQGFCLRHRGIKGTQFTVQPSSVSVKGATLSATLVNGGYQDTTMRLIATALADGMVHLLIDEAPEVGRYRMQVCQERYCAVSW